MIYVNGDIIRLKIILHEIMYQIVQLINQSDLWRFFSHSFLHVYAYLKCEYISLFEINYFIYHTNTRFKL